MNGARRIKNEKLKEHQYRSTEKDLLGVLRITVECGSK